MLYRISCFVKKHLQNYFQLLEEIINDGLFDMPYGHLGDLQRYFL